MRLGVTDMSKKRSSARQTRRPASPIVRRKKRAPRQNVIARKGGVTVTEVEELDELRREIVRASAGRSPLRWNADPDEVRRSVAQLVLTLVEFIRRLLERQAIRRMEAKTLSEEQVEAVGEALMKLEETVRDMAASFGIPPDELNLDLGPIGKLM